VCVVCECFCDDIDIECLHLPSSRRGATDKARPIVYGFEMDLAVCRVEGPDAPTLARVSVYNNSNSNNVKCVRIVVIIIFYVSFSCFRLPAKHQSSP